VRLSCSVVWIRRSSRETCIWLMPNRAPMSLCVKPCEYRSRRSRRSRDESRAMACRRVIAVSTRERRRWCRAQCRPAFASCLGPGCPGTDRGNCAQRLTRPVELGDRHAQVRRHVLVVGFPAEVVAQFALGPVERQRVPHRPSGAHQPAVVAKVALDLTGDGGDRVGGAGRVRARGVPEDGLPEAQEGDLVDVVVVDAAAVVAPGDAERHRLV
jgi:hypothetical protein